MVQNAVSLSNVTLAEDSDKQAAHTWFLGSLRLNMRLRYLLLYRLSVTRNRLNSSFSMRRATLPTSLSVMIKSSLSLTLEGRRTRVKHGTRTLGPRRDTRQATHLFHRISFSERRMFCRICEFGCDGVGLEGPRRPGAGEAKGTEAAMGFLAAPKAAEPASVLEADVAVPGTSLACLTVGVALDGAAESHGLLGMVPLKPGGTFLMAALAPTTLTKGGDFFGRRLRGEGCLPPSREPGGTTFLGAAAAARFSSACLLSLTAVERRTR